MVARATLDLPAKAGSHIVGELVLPLALICTLAVVPALAQGKGNAFGHSKGGRNSGPSAAGAPEVQGGAGSNDVVIPGGTGVRNFGSWLDDASVASPGQGFATVSFGYWRTPSYREIDVPVIDGGVGLHRRVQVAMSVPWYHASQPGGPVARGMGDMYLSAKVQLRDPESHRAGFALVPAVEVLSTAPAPDESRVGWALPVAMEIRGNGWRTFASTGYFSRGSLFASGAVEVLLSDRAWVTGTISQSHSMKRDDLSGALGLVKTRTDVSGGAVYVLTSSLALFGTVGRTISKLDDNSSTLALSAGLSVNFTHRRP
jgi:hypothetical protein